MRNLNKLVYNKVTCVCKLNLKKIIFQHSQDCKNSGLTYHKYYFPKAEK